MWCDVMWCSVPCIVMYGAVCCVVFCVVWCVVSCAELCCALMCCIVSYFIIQSCYFHALSIYISASLYFSYIHLKTYVNVTDCEKHVMENDVISSFLRFFHLSFIIELISFLCIWCYRGLYTYIQCSNVTYFDLARSF